MCLKQSQTTHLGTVTIPPIYGDLGDALFLFWPHYLVFSIFIVFSIIDHPAIGVSPFLETPRWTTSEELLNNCSCSANINITLSLTSCLLSMNYLRYYCLSTAIAIPWWSGLRRPSRANLRSWPSRPRQSQWGRPERKPGWGTRDG